MYVILRGDNSHVNLLKPVNICQRIDVASVLYFVKVMGFTKKDRKTSTKRGAGVLTDKTGYSDIKIGKDPKVYLI